MVNFFPHTLHVDTKIMVFVDGENLSIRYGNTLASQNEKPQKHVYYLPNVYAWSVSLNNVCARRNVLRKYYYTSIKGDEKKIVDCIDELKAHGIEAPRVFKKTKNRGSKRVDISLATDMLSHAFRKNYDIAVLVAGDEDYVPLVKAVQSEGCRVYLWFLENGLSPFLKRTVDRFTDIEEIFFSLEIRTLP
jgi:uncharacterized LabA/DUF88 family protein